MTFNVDPKDDPVSKVVAGSLLSIRTDSSAVDYDPNYSADTGSGDCDIIIATRSLIHVMFRFPLVVTSVVISMTTTPRI